jgi:hypothetical protein
MNTNNKDPRGLGGEVEACGPEQKIARHVARGKEATEGSPEQKSCCGMKFRSYGGSSE